MKKRLIFSGMILLALVLTGGMFAYTYSGFASVTLSSAAAAEAIATYTPSAHQPDWDSILPEGEYDSEYLLPDAAGDDTELTPSDPTKQNWELVVDMPADEGTTYVSTLSSNHWERDLYNLNDHMESGGYETINSVTVYFRFAAGGDYEVRAMAAIKTNGEVFEGPNETQSGETFATYSYQWTNNPATNKAWTWEEIDGLQAGVTIRGDHKTRPALCTQVYVVVNYEFVVTQGAVPKDDLYDITPHPDYSGDLQFKVYLTNTANLTKAYQYLNMKLKVDDSLEANKKPDYLVLSMENGVALFNIEGKSADSYTIEVIGGSYRLVSGDSSEWGEGWSIAPEFYCEVSQR